jgi:putative peptide zinc metalloprotease protein
MMSFFPKFRRDIKVHPRVEEGEGLQYVFKDPRNDKIFAFGEMEYLICRHLDGRTSLPAIQDILQQQYDISISLEQLEAFIRHLVILELVAYPLPPGEIPWHFPVYYKKFGLGNPDRWIARGAPLFSWCFTRFFAISLGLLVFLGLMILFNHFSAYRREVKYLLWNPGLFFLETLLGIFVINGMAEVCKATALKHYGGGIPEACVGLAYRLVPTFHFDLADLWMKKKSKQLIIFSAGLVGQLFLWTVGLLAWKVTYPWSAMHRFWVVFTVAAQFFFLINLIPLLPRDGYYLLSTWKESPDLWYRSRNLVQAWFYRNPLPEPLTRRERLGFMVFGISSIIFVWSFWFLVLGLLGYLLTYYWKLKGLGFSLLLILLTLRYGDAVKQLMTRWFPSRAPLVNDEGSAKPKYLFRIALVALIIIVLLIPYPFEAGGEFKILPLHQVSIRAVVRGEIQKIMIHEGQWLQKGQTVAVLLDKDQRAQMESIKEQLAGAREKLTLLKKGPKSEQVAKAEQEVKLAAKALQYSSVEANRFTQMFQEKAVSDLDFQNVLKTRDEDRERLLLAKKNLEVVKNPFRPEEIRQQEAEVRRLEAELVLAEKNLKLTEIISPAEGRFITARPMQTVGQFLEVGDLLGVIEDARHLVAEIEVPEEDIDEVKMGRRVKLRIWGNPTKTLYGSVLAIAPAGYDQARGRVERVLTEREFRTMQVVPPQGKVIRVLSEFPITEGIHTDMTGYAKIEGTWMPVGVAFTRWLIRFIWVEVWSWIP